MAGADSVIPPPLEDDDDDVAWALQTAAVQWNRGGRADAVVWLRRAVDAAIAAGNPARTKDLTRLASAVADRLVEEAARAPDSAAPPPPSHPPSNDVDDLLDAPSVVPPPRGSAPRATAPSLSSEIPIDFSDDEPVEEFDGEFEDDDALEDDDDAPTIPPPSNVAESLPGTPAVSPAAVARAPVIDDEDEEDGELVGSMDIWSHRPSSSSERDDSARDSEVRSGAPGPLSQDAREIRTGEVSSATPLPEVGLGESPSEAVAESALDDDEASGPQLDEPISDGEATVPELDGPTLTREPPAPTAASELDQRDEPRAAAASEPPWEGPPVVGGIALESVRGFEDLPEETQAHLASVATLTTLAAEEEVGSFGAALVTNGTVGIMPSIADVASAVAAAGEIVFTRGSLPEGVALRVVALSADTVVASWTSEELDAAFADCPWVADELRLVADRFQALAGATLGPLGDRLDEALRGQVLSHLEVKAYGPGETIVTEGKPVPGLHVVGGGKVELVEGDAVKDEAAPGDFLFAAEVLSAGKAKLSARAGKGGALILFAPRSVAHEMLMSVPPLLEILAG